MSDSTYILGISAFYHDSAACLLRDGEIIAAAQEERFTRKKHDSSFPSYAIEYCLREAGIEKNKINHVAFYDKPWIKFERLLETYLAFAPRGLSSFYKAVPIWIKEKLWMGNLIGKELEFDDELIYPEHHQSHAASAFFPSPFKEAAILTLDGVGEWTTTSYGVGVDNKITLTHDIQFPHSIGLLYSAMTYYTGFKVNSGEYKVMGLAPYGNPVYFDKIMDHLIDLKEDGSFRLNMDYFDYCHGLKMTSKKFDELFGAPARKPESPISQREMDLARSIQDVTEEIIIRIAKHVRSTTGKNNLCLAGGVALNCVANGKILKEKIFDSIWIQPAAGDAGGALGAALFAWHQVLGKRREVNKKRDSQFGSLLGPRPDSHSVETYLMAIQAPFKKLPKKDLYLKVAELLSNEKVVGWCSGRMEFGPRALGARSILGDPRSPKTQKTMNLKIKYRESFRPFAPSCLKELASDYFDLDSDSPYMLIVAPVKEERRMKMSEEEEKLFGIEKLNISRSDIPAITHVDYSARVQTVEEEVNPDYYNLIKEFHKLTNYGVLVNTSFNVRGEPIVCTHEDAYRCFMRTEMDALVIEDYLLLKEEQPSFKDLSDWQNEFELD